MEEESSKKEEIREEKSSRSKACLTKIFQRRLSQKVFREGKKYSSNLVSLYFLKSQNGGASFAIHARKKLGIAVVRNRIKRIFREAVRAQKISPIGYDFILVPRQESGEIGSKYLANHLKEIFIRTGISDKE